MKKNAFLYLYFLLQSFIVSAQPGNNTVPSDKIMIDPMNAIGGSASNVFEQVTYIPLETTKESLFGAIDQLQITDEYFIVLDHSTDAISFFNKNGKFHHKISKFILDVEFYQQPRPGYTSYKIISFKVAPDKEELYVQSVFERQSLYVLDFEGKRIRKQVLPPNTVDYYFFKATLLFLYAIMGAMV